MPGPKFTIDAIAKRYTDVDAAMRSGKLNLPRALASYAHVVKDNGLAMTNLDSAQSDEADDDAGSIPFVISTYQEDRDGDVVVPAGCRLENFAKNPVCFFGHQEWPVPIGRCKSPDGRVTVWPEDDQIRAIIYFDRADPDADLIYGKVKRGYLNATSIAFVPLKAVRREDVEKARTRNQPMAPPGWLFQEYDLTEVSVVGVPSNQDAIREMLDSEKSFISPRLQKALRPYAAKARGRCFSGWCSGPECQVDKGDPAVAAKKKPAPAKKVAPAKSSCSCGNCQAGRACGCAKGKQKSVQADIEGQGQQPGGRTGQQVPETKAEQFQPGDKVVANFGATGTVIQSGGVSSNEMMPGAKPGSPWVKVQWDVEWQGKYGKTGDVRTSSLKKKALTSTSGTFGGYTIEPGKVENQDDSTPALTDTATDGYVRCESCFESPGNCTACDGKGSITSEDGEGVDCPECKGSGECVDCGGVGQVPKPEGSGTPEKSVRKARGNYQVTQNGKVVDEHSVSHVDDAKPIWGAVNPDGVPMGPKNVTFDEAYSWVQRMRRMTSGGDMERVRRFKQSPPTASVVPPAAPASSPAMAVDDPQTALAKLYGHAKAEVDYLDGLPDEQKATLAEYRDEVGNRMETIKAAFGEQFPGDDFDKCLAKAMESDGSSDTMEPGEAGEVESGRIPPETKPMQKDKPNYDAGEHSCDMCGGTGKINYAGNDTKPCTACGGTGVIKPGRGRTKPKGATMARRKTQQKEQAVPGTATVMQGDDDVAGELDSGAAPYNKDSSGTGDSVAEGDAPYNDASAPQEKAEPFAGEETPEEEDLEDAIQGKDSTGIGDPVNPPGDQSYNKNGDAMAASCPGCGAPGTGKPFCADCGSPADGGASKDSTGTGDSVIAPGDQSYNKNGFPPGADDAMPPDQVTADSQTGGMVGDPAEGSAPPDTDADTQEILERYRQPKSLVWQTRKWEVHLALLPYLKTRTTKSGDVYLVRKGDNPFAPDDDDEKKSDVTPSQGEIIVGSGTVKGMLARVTEVKDHLAAVYKAGDIPAHHKAGFKHGWTQLGYVGKALTDMGKFQSNSGKGSPLSNAGHVQSNDGGGSKLDDKGEVQANRKSAVRQVSPAVEQRLNNFLRFAQQNGISVN